MATLMAPRPQPLVSFLMRRVSLSPPLGFMQPASGLGFSPKTRSRRTHCAAWSGFSAGQRGFDGADMIPGEIFPASGEIILNKDRAAISLRVANTGDRPVQVGSHYHFAETNAALAFDRRAALGYHLDIPAGTAVRFEPGQSREVSLIPYGGARLVYGFNRAVMGALPKTTTR